MTGRSFVIFIIYCYLSYKFLTKFSKSRDKELTDALKPFAGTECPAGITLYRLKFRGALYRIQIQEKLPHNIIETNSLLRKCEKVYAFTDGTHSAKVLPNHVDNVHHENHQKDYMEYEDADAVTLNLLEEICDMSSSVTDGLESAFDERTTNPLISNPFMSYMLQVVKGPEPMTVSVFTNDTETWPYLTVASGIFPGTLWCGFGNMAEDMYGQVGEHSETDDCCRSHDLCKPIIKAFQTRYFYSNPSVLPISHCGCDNQFYNCLLKVNSPTSKMIGRIFFNLVNMKCFDFDVREVCVSEILGLCQQRKQKCAAVLRSNKLFPT